MTNALALLVAGLGALGQPPPAPPPPPPVNVGADSVPVEGDRPGGVFAAPVARDTLRAAPAPAVVDAYRADPAFQYDRPEAQGPSLWDRFWGWVRRTFWDPVAENTSAEVRDWVVIGVAVAALGWALARLLQVGGVGVFQRGERTAAGAGPLLDVDDIAEVDLGTRLRAALEAGDHREAVRVRYLALLQALDAGGLVAWRRDKTNRQYVAEVAAADAARGRAFRRATRAFDAVWYGERAVSAGLYARLGPVFDAAAP